MDKYFALGLPGGSEKLIVGRPFQEDNGNLGLWSWQKTQAAPLPKDYSKERQAQLLSEFNAERKKFDVEAQSQGFSSAEARGKKALQDKRDEEARVKAEKAAAKAAKAAADAAAKEQTAAAAAKQADAKKNASPTKPVYYQ